MSVSMVAVPCLRFVHAARWKGHAAQTITGAARAREAHCQNGNCRAGIIDIAITGTVSTTDPTSRWRSDVSSGSASPPGLSAAASRSRRGRAAVYPVFSTSLISSAGS